MTLAVSVIFAALMACYIIPAAFVEGSQFRLPTLLNRRAVAAMVPFQAGVALLKSEPARAEGQFRKALPLWERLVQDDPSELGNKIVLESTRTSLAITALRRAGLARQRTSSRNLAQRGTCSRRVRCPHRRGQPSIKIATSFGRLSCPLGRYQK